MPRARFSEGGHEVQRIALIVLVLFILWRLLTAVGKRLVRDSAGAEDFSRFSARRRDRRDRFRPKGGTRNDELVECAGCASWVPSSRASRARDGSAYCSETCKADHAARGTGS